MRDDYTEGIRKYKDPIYGYIGIPKEYFSEIIDKPEFQRLRRIIQTSYSPLYASALHNRFVHSIGVYYLGVLASDALVQAVSEDQEIKGLLNIERYAELFKYACLLHDVGHAPFSHTGENFYLNGGGNKKGNSSKNQYRDIHRELSEAIAKEKDAQNWLMHEFSLRDPAKPHEIMSSIIGLRDFSGLFSNDEEKEFFARAITGYTYEVSSTENLKLFNRGVSKEDSLKDCFIRMLNSRAIDVDKMDYLIRDAYITGYDSVAIDYRRLLSAITVIKDPVIKADDRRRYRLAYKKSAISVLENVVYARDFETKWIQCHPTVMYDSYLVGNIVRMISNVLDSEDARLFSSQSLGSTGVSLKKEEHVSLLTDDDIVYLSKKHLSGNPDMEEYFDRRRRMHPIWKSEAEYNAYFLLGNDDRELRMNFEDIMAKTVLYLSKSGLPFKLNQDLLNRVEKEADESNILGKQIRERDQDSFDEMDDARDSIRSFLKFLKAYSEEKGYEDFEYVILQSNMFNSGFDKPDFSDMYIKYGEDTIAKVKTTITSLEGTDTSKGKYYYLYYRRTGGFSKGINIKDFCEAFITRINNVDNYEKQ